MIKPVTTTPIQQVTPNVGVTAANVVVAKPLVKVEVPANPSDQSDVNFHSEAPVATPAATVVADKPKTAPAEETPKGPDVVTSMESHDPSVLEGLKPESVVAARDGEMLGSGAILKYDYFPKVINKDLKPLDPAHPEDAVNFRQVKGTNVYGVGQATVSGIRKVLDEAGAKDKTVMWTNMREEPVLYINGKSVSLRDIKKPFENSDHYQGLTGKEMEATEKDLKAELLAEADKYPGKSIMVHGEDKDGNVTTEWIQLTKDNVKTPKEVYNELKKEGYKVDYKRVPVTDEKTPEADDLEALTKRISKADPDTPQIFNCHAGRGRTTTAMVAAQLIQDAKRRAKDGGDDSSKPFQSIPSVHQDIREQGQYQRGEYKLILRTIKALDHGVESKGRTDEVLDRTQDMQNLRTEIVKYKDKRDNATSDEARAGAQQRGIDYLHRYHTLITFEEYCNDQAKDGFKVPYGKWVDSKPELKKMLEGIELAYNKPAADGVGYA